MNFSDYSKEKELEKDLQNLLDGKVTLSKSEILDFLKKDEEEIVEEESSEEISFKDFVEEEPVEEIPEEEVSESPQPSPKLMDRLLDEVETPSEPTVAPKAGTFLLAGGGGENNAGTNVGNGVEIFKGIGINGGSPLQLRTLSASGSASVTQVGDLIVIGASVSADNDSWPAVSADYYTSNEVDNLISAVSADNDSWTIVSGDYYTSNEVDNLISAVSADNDSWTIVSGDYYTSIQVNSISSTLSAGLSGQDKWSSVSASYYTSVQTNNLLSNKADLSAVSADNDSWTTVSGDYYTSNEVDVIVSGLSGLSGTDSWTIVSGDYYTKEETVNGTPTFREVIFDNNISANPEYKEGTLFYDSTEKTLTLYPHISGVSLQIGQETYVRARNNTGSVIENGSVVEVYGALGNRPLIRKAISRNVLERVCILGVATHDIGHNTDGFVTTEGVVGSLNTNVYAEGTTLYLSTTTSGAFTSAIPSAPYCIVKIGYVIRKNTEDGKILVKIETRGKLTELSDVDGIVPDDYSMLTYYESSGFWNPSTSGQWDDLTFPATRGQQGNNDKPDFDYTNLGLLFPQNLTTEDINILVQFPHKRKYNTPIRPHLHYIQTTSALPVFEMQYRWYNNGDLVPSYTTISTSGSIGAFPYTSGSMLQILKFPEIDGTGKTISSMMDVIIYRNDNVVAGDVLVKEYDIHYVSDSFGGSRDEYIK